MTDIEKQLFAQIVLLLIGFVWLAIRDILANRRVDKLYDELLTLAIRTAVKKKSEEHHDPTQR